MNKIKAAYEKFHAWQLEPFSFKKHNTETVRCANCGTEFTDNYCPRCGQKANEGRITWATVRQGIMLMWGLESRSLAYSLLQLFLRPGYLIGDYISGKRKVSFPPVKMLFIVALAVIVMMQIVRYFAPEAPTEQVDDLSVWIAFTNWADKNIALANLLMCMVLIFPTWIFFRFAPRHDHHTLPEGFFIQVFMATLVVILSLGEFVSDWLQLAVLIYYVIAYKQLFGYGWWGTTWRTMLCFIEWLVIMQVVIATLEIIITRHAIGKNGLVSNIIIILGIAILGVALALIGYFISKKTAKQRAAKAETASELPTE